MTSLIQTLKQIKPSVCPIAFSQPTPIAGQVNINVVGSGFAVSASGFICTCAHVVNGKQGQLHVGYLQPDQNYKFLVGNIALIDLEKDFALIKIENLPQGINFSPMNIGSSSGIAEGQDVAFYGFPFGGSSGGGFSASATKGIISAVRRIIIGDVNHPSVTIFQLDAMTMEGNSGAPLFDIESGAVLGIVNARFDPLMQGNIPQITVGGRPLGFPTNIGFAIPIDAVRDLINSKIESVVTQIV